MTVSDLRACGYKVRVLHHRKWNSCGISCKGGTTVIQVRTPDGTELEGIAVCSKEDNYNKKLGVSIALGRALKNNNLSCRPKNRFILKGGPCGLVKNK
jgi:hypothetical protein